MRTAYLAASLAAALLAAEPAAGEVINLTANARGSNEIPPNTASGAATLTATYDTATRQFRYKGNYSGLSGPATGLHFHGPAGPTQNAGIVIPVNPPAASFEGSATLTEAQANDLLAGRWYLNVHTEMHRGGELRGQVVR
jgi:hypothetical protein